MKSRIRVVTSALGLAAIANPVLLLLAANVQTETTASEIERRVIGFQTQLRAGEFKTTAAAIIEPLDMH